MTAQDLVSVINSNSSKEQFALALPDHIKPERFARILTTSVMNDHRLSKANPEQLIKEATQIAALGLVTETQLGEAYLIADHKGGVQRRIGYRGLIKLARQGGIKTVYAEDVCENDKFSIVLGTEKRIEHEPAVKDRGNPYLYYAVMVDGSGNTDFEYMTIEQLHDIRDNRSDGWKAFKANKIRSTPWATDEGEMCKKTVLRRLMKRAPMDSDKAADAIAAAFNAEDAADSMKDVTPDQPEKVKNGPVKSMDDIIAFHAPDPGETVIDEETGEVIENDAIKIWISEDEREVDKETPKDAFQAIANRVKFLVGNGERDAADDVLENNSSFISALTKTQQERLNGLIQ